MQRLAGDTAGAKVTAEQARNTLEQLYRDQPDNAYHCGKLVCGLCCDGGEGLGPKGSGACNHASAPWLKIGGRTWLRREPGVNSDDLRRE